MKPEQTFFFYDLETSGLDARRDRVMQFAGQRTNMNLEVIEEPVNILVRLNDDVLPSPEAVMVTGITPQQTQADGMSEAEFAQMLMEQIFTPGTTTVGFNSVRFDDEFIRHTLWRNFYDPYEWCWKDSRSRWDLLDVVRMTRALRPEGIEWPVDAEGRPTNRLELLTKLNNLEHLKAHDALSDVRALIAVTKMIRGKQPKLYDFLYKVRSKKEIANIVNLEDAKPFVYSSGRYASEYQKTTVALPVAPGAKPGSVLVYDLRHDPTQFADMSLADIKKRLFAKWEERKAPDFVPIPVKELAYNKCPAVAPLGVLEQGNGWENIHLDAETVQKNLQILQRNRGSIDKVKEALDSRPPFPKAKDVDGRLYDSFMNDRDKTRCEVVRNATERELADFHPEFADERLPKLLLRYKARNYPQTLSDTERAEYEQYRSERLQSDLPKYMGSIAKMAKNTQDENTQYLLQELQLWAESVVPVEEVG